MTATNGVLLVFGLGTFLRGVYALVVQDVTEDGEHMVGRPAVWLGVSLVVVGLGIASHAIFEWPWINALVNWIRQLD